MTEPNPPEGVILEPGDPGYVDPNAPEPPVIEPAPPGQDLQHQRAPGETDAEFLARTRHTVVRSESPTDIVPNTPQIGMGERVPVEGTNLEADFATPPPGTGMPPGGAPEAEAQAPPPGSEELAPEDKPV